MTLVLEPPPCPWCDRTDCPRRFDHDRDDRASESTWRRAAAVLQPDHPNLPGGAE